ncbi:primase C-terminal domain-containing protein [Carnobacterium maltaromaticum]|uniref:Primase C-terminal domain-containing protein n=1 Tax=Carnobacterium maltaromaticum TaxID=2751 RepID=A0AAW9K7I3_CARML|nr:primase C-terminal domain-containing protein [Carnobacterium maltaromaticum]MDZ5760621.1 primase C-terminal domain-containing protein [Carnobacterium maltaromaticum]
MLEIGVEWATEARELILNGGMKRYKERNSKILSMTHKEDKNKKGSIFAFRSKEAMQESRGIVLTSLEGLDENPNLTHWTPNIYGWGGYADAGRNYVKGHFEKNLNQINCFVVDIDCSEDKKLSTNEVVLESLNTDLGLLPTLILETPAGYHVYYVLDHASYVSSRNNYKSLNVAKAISISIRLAFEERLGSMIDVTCNHFGIFRVPNKENIVHFEQNFTYKFETLMNWSIKYQEKRLIERKSKFTVVKPELKKIKYRQVDSMWYKALIQAESVDCGQGTDSGRDNTIFTLALANFSSGVQFQDCLNELDQFNSQLTNPLAHRIVEQKIISAYSGDYQGASSQFIDLLVNKWVKSDQLQSLKKQNTGRVDRSLWVKHAKKREDRQRSHYHEWREDFLNYIHSKTSYNNPTLEITTTEIVQALGIPLSTLKDLMKQLRTEGELFVKTTRGRYGKTFLTTKSLMMQLIIRTKKEQLDKFQQALFNLIPSTHRVFQKLKERALEQRERAIEQGVLHIDSG